MRNWLLLILLLWASPSFAVITIGTVTNASATDLTETTPVIYGGIAGSCASVTGTCDSCAATPGTGACNRNRISSGLTLRIEFTSSTSAGVPKLLFNTTAVALTGAQGVCSQGSTCYVQALWSTICGQDSGDSTCGTSDTISGLSIGVSSGNNVTLEDSTPIAINISSIGTTAGEINSCTSGTLPSDGICDWTAYPGDGKIYLREPTPATTSFPTAPTGSVIPITKLRVFHSTVSHAAIQNDTADYTDLPIVAGSTAGTSELTNRVVDDLDNGTLYYFKVAVVDDAGNQGFLTSATAVTEVCGGAPADATCDFMATPDEVYGLLTEDMNCFISTAAFGSSLDKHVQTFREFRNKFLLPNYLGKQFVLKYYEVGPRAAMWLHKNPEFKPAVRAALWPMYALAWLALKTEAILFPTANAQEGETEDSFFEEQNGEEPKLTPTPIQERKKTNLPPPTSTTTETPKEKSLLPSFQPSNNPRGYSDSKKREFVPHPLAEKGLIKIQRDGVYRYKVEKSPQKQSASFRIGMFTPEELRNSETDPNIYYTDIYEDDQSPIFFFDWQYTFFRGFGKLSWKLESGLLVSQGNGRFENDPAGNTPALELFTFAGFPSSAGVSYRLQFWDGQILVPYAEGGGMAIPFAEFRDDGKSPKFGAGYGAFFAAGAALNLSSFDMDLLYEMDREYGINSTWFEAEIRQQISASKFDFSGTVFAAGFHFEF